MRVLIPVVLEAAKGERLYSTLEMEMVFLPLRF